MTKTVWKDTVTGKIYKIDRVEEAARQVALGMSFEAIRALLDEQCSKAEIIKFFVNRRNVYDVATLLLTKRFELAEIDVSMKWVEDDTGTEFYSYEELLGYIEKDYDVEDDVMGYLDDRYESSEIVRAIEKNTYQELLAQARAKVIQNIIDACFTVTEIEI